MSDPFDDPPSPGADRSGVDRVRPRASVTSPGMPRPTSAMSSGDDDDNIFGATLSGKTPVATRAEAAPPARGRTDPSSSSGMSGSGPAERGTDPGLRPPPSRNRSGLMVVRASEVVAAAPPPAPVLNPSLLPPRRVTTAPPGPQPAPPAPPPLVDLDSILAPGAPPAPVMMSLDDLLAPTSSPSSPPPPPSLSTSGAPRPPPPPPMAPPPPRLTSHPGSQPRPAAVPESSAPTRRPTGLMGLDPPVEPSTPTRRPTGLMGLDPPVEPSTPTKRPTGLMGLDPVVEPSTPTKRPSTQVTGSFGRPEAAPPARVVTNPALAAMGIADDDGPPMAPRLPPPTGLREDGTPMSAAEAALPSLFKTPEQIQRRRIKIAATGVAAIALAAVTVVLWIVNRPPPPRTGSVIFAVAQKATVTSQYVAGLVRLENADVEPVVARIVASVARSLLPKDAPPPAVILTDEAEPVAFSTPDGRLLLSRGMLMALVSQAELAALAAHLLVHQTHYHLDDAIDAEAKALIPDVNVAISSNMATPGSRRVATVGLWHTFTDAEEIEADADAVVALKRANWDAAAVRTLWERLEGLTPRPTLVGLHPLTPARRSALEAAEKLRLQGSDLVRGDTGRINSVEYQTQIKDVLAPPATRPVKARPSEPAPAAPISTPQPTETRVTTRVAEPKVAPKKPPKPEPTPTATPSSPRDPND